MRYMPSTSGRNFLTCVVLGMAALPGFVPTRLAAAETTARNQSGSGAFVSFQGGTLTIKGKAGVIVYDHVGENYKTYHNNEEGPGSRLVSTLKALGGEKLPGNITPLTRVLPGTFVTVNVEEREICIGFDYRVIGTFVSYQDGKLNLLAADVPPGFVQKPAGKIVLTIDPDVPALKSTGDYLEYAGTAAKVLKAAQPGVLVTARSQYDPEAIEVIEIGSPKYQMERYIGQARGPVRGAFVSFKGDILRIRGKGLAPLAETTYEELIVRRVADNIPIVESIDGGAYRPVSVDALKTAKEGTIITIRKASDVIFGIEIGIAKHN